MTISLVHNPHSTVSIEGHFLRFSDNSKASTSELLEIFENMLPLYYKYYMHSNMINIFKYSTIPLAKRLRNVCSSTLPLWATHYCQLTNLNLLKTSLYMFPRFSRNIEAECLLYTINSLHNFRVILRGTLNPWTHDFTWSSQPSNA